MAPAEAGKTSGNLPPCGFMVSAGKKGNVPISIEKRPKGKKVTIISNVQGSAQSLLSALSSLLGTGGTVRQEASGRHWTVEIQGDQSERVNKALAQLGCLRGVKKLVEEEQKKPVETDCARTVRRKAEPERDSEVMASFKAQALAAAELLPPNIDCRNWHGDWFYCRGRCVQNDWSDVWEESLEDNGYCRSSSSTAPIAPPTSVAELNIALRGLGLLSQVGATFHAPTPTRQPTGSGLTLDDYRKAALAPGARLITDEENPRRPKAKQRAQSRAASKPAKEYMDRRSRSVGPPAQRSGAGKRSSQATRPPPKIGTYGCPVCHSVFSLQKTLKLHIKNAHDGASIPIYQRAAPPRQRPSPVDVICRPCETTIPSQSGTPSPKENRRSAAEVWRPSAQAARESSRGPDLAQAPKPSAVSEERGGPNPKAKKALGVCPVCLEFFEQSKLQAHVDECLQKGQPASEDDSSDEEVLQHQGPLLAEEYWCEDDRPPAAVEDPFPDFSSHRPIEDGRASSEADLQKLHNGNVPGEWLDSLLQLNLSEYWSDQFWAEFHNLQETISDIRVAWSTALENTLDRSGYHIGGDYTSGGAGDTPEDIQEFVVIESFTGDPSANQISVFLGDRLQILWRQPEEEGQYWAWVRPLGRPGMAAPENNDAYVPLRCIDGETYRDNQTGELRVVGGGAHQAGKKSAQVARSVASGQVEQARRPKKKQEPKAEVSEVFEEAFWIAQQSEKSEVVEESFWIAPEEDEEKHTVPAENVSNGGIAKDRWARRRGGGARKQPLADKERASPHLEVAGPALASEAVSERLACPVCGKEVEARALQDHVNSCMDAQCYDELPPKVEALQTRDSRVLAQSSRGRDAELGDAARRWAKPRILDLSSRFCIGPLDADVALSMLWHCASAIEMRNEAINMFAENAPVKNFAAELWQRKSSSAR